MAKIAQAFFYLVYMQIFADSNKSNPNCCVVVVSIHTHSQESQHHMCAMLTYYRPGYIWQIGKATERSKKRSQQRRMQTRQIPEYSTESDGGMSGSSKSQPNCLDILFIHCQICYRCHGLVMITDQ